MHSTQKILDYCQKNGNGDGLLVRIDKIETFLETFDNDEAKQKCSPQELEQLETIKSRLEEFKEQMNSLLSPTTTKPTIDESDAPIENAIESNNNASTISTQPPLNKITKRKPFKRSNWKITENSLSNGTDSKEELNSLTEQDKLSFDLLHLSKSLKANNIALNKHLQEDSKVLEETDHLLTDSTARFSKTHKSLNEYSDATWASTWRLIFVALLVMVGVVGVFMLIIATSKNK